VAWDKNLLEEVEKFLEEKPDQKAFNTFMSKYCWRGNSQNFEHIVQGHTKTVLDNIFKGLNGNEQSYWDRVDFSPSYSSSVFYGGGII